jgi:hypothetical protein
MKGEGAVDAGSGFGIGGAGERRAVMACMLWRRLASRMWGTGGLVPVKGTGEGEVVVAGELAHARVEFAVVDEAAGLVDYEEGEDNPVPC